MGRELFLLRHGKSDWSTGVKDFDRPLKKRGKAGAQRIGAWLQENRVVPDRIISSPAARAINTAEKCVKAAGLTARHVTVDPRLYMANVETTLGVLAEVSQDSLRVMLVGHNPCLEEVLEYLARDRLRIPDDGKLLPTATVARISMPDDWSALARHSGEVVDVVRARSLPEKFPYPAPDGAERRDRPAYYYTQSAVIPYRIKDGQPEVMVIGSSGKKHWSVPKGIVEPGLSPEESARQEAWEEAGITGQVDQNMLGSCQIEKWGAKCHVSVFAMKVENQMPSGQWQENHRGRKWVDIKTACSLLKHNELKPILLSLEKSLKQHG